MTETKRKDESILAENEQKMLQNTIKKLKQFFPEHKVYAFDTLCRQQRENSVKLAKKLGYETVDDFLLAYGFKSIKGSEVYEIRKDCGIKPGEEPDFIKARIDNAINNLNEYYPSHVIEGAIQNDHNNLAKNLAGFWQWLGYESMEDMLSAYGFTYNVKRGRAKSVDPESIIAELKSRYPDGVNMTVNEIKEANPDLKIKSVMNKSNDLFGMSFAHYLVEQGVIVKKRKKSDKTEAEKREAYFETIQKYDSLIQNYFLGWRPLPTTSEIMLKELGKQISPKRYYDAIKELSVNEDSHIDALGVLANQDTDNELRSLIQIIDFNLLEEQIMNNLRDIER